MEHQDLGISNWVTRVLDFQVRVQLSVLLFTLTSAHMLLCTLTAACMTATGADTEKGCLFWSLVVSFASHLDIQMTPVMTETAAIIATTAAIMEKSLFSYGCPCEFGRCRLATPP